MAYRGLVCERTALAFASSRTGTYEIYTMHEAGSRVRRQTKGGEAFMPDWS